MGKRQRKLKSLEESEEEGRKGSKPRIEAVSSDDGAEANEDLTLKIVEKSLQLRHPQSNCVSDIDADLKQGGKENVKRKKSKEVELAVERDSSDDLEGKQEDDGAIEISDDRAIEISINALDSNSVDNSGNVVLRKLLRGPRYFDPPDKSWGACYNCGEEGHTSINCPSEKRKKPCFVCGSFDHIARHCTQQSRDCFICLQKGHHARDCPKKQKGFKVCLRCGDIGHTMCNCRNGYSADDLKEIECYTCGKFGHICCADYTDPGPREISCYRCGLSGHTGLECTGYSKETANAPRDGACFKCGVIGHFSRECPNSKKAIKKNSEPSTPKQESIKRKKGPAYIKSAPVKPGKKKYPLIPEFASAGKLKHMVGLVAEHPSDLDAMKSKHRRGWVAEHPANSYAGKRKHRGGWTAEHPGDSYRGEMGAPGRGFLEMPYDRRSMISTPNVHYAFSSPGSSQNHYHNGFNSPAYNRPGGFYHQNEFPSPGFVPRRNHWSGARYGQW